MPGFFTNLGHTNLILTAGCGSYGHIAVIGNGKTNGSKRHIPVIEPAQEAAGYRHAWWLKFGRIDQREGAILSRMYRR